MDRLLDRTKADFRNYGVSYDPACVQLYARKLQDRSRKTMAVYDFDRTLSEGNITYEAVVYLAGKAAISNTSYKKVRDLALDYKSGKITQPELYVQWVDAWAKELEGRRYAVISEHFEDFFDGFKAHLFPSTKVLVSEVDKKVTYSMIVSASDQSLISLAAKSLGVIDTVSGTDLEVLDGVYTGRVTSELHKVDGKSIRVWQLARAGDIDMNGSIAFGDSKTDVSVLKRFKYPIALNPDTELTAIARQRNWHVFTHQNVVSEVQELLRGLPTQDSEKKLRFRRDMATLLRDKELEKMGHKKEPFAYQVVT